MMLKNTGTENKNEILEQDQTDCHYMGGYPGWHKQMAGKLVLEGSESHTERLLFVAPDGEQITIPISKIERASILTQRKGVDEDDLMLEITCLSLNGEKINPILSLPSSSISHVMKCIGPSGPQSHETA